MFQERLLLLKAERKRFSSPLLSSWGDGVWESTNSHKHTHTHLDRIPRPGWCVSARLHFISSKHCCPLSLAVRGDRKLLCLVREKGIRKCRDAKAEPPWRLLGVKWNRIQPSTKWLVNRDIQRKHSCCSLNWWDLNYPHSPGKCLLSWTGKLRHLVCFSTRTPGKNSDRRTPLPPLSPLLLLFLAHVRRRMTDARSLAASRASAPAGWQGHAGGPGGRARLLSALMNGYRNVLRVSSFSV